MPAAILPDRALEFSHDLLPEAVHHALAGHSDQRDIARLSWLEAHGSPRRDIEPHTARSVAIELQRRIGFEKVVVRTDLDGPIAGIGDGQRDGTTALVDLDFAGLDEHFAGNHAVT